VRFQLHSLRFEPEPEPDAGAAVAEIKDFDDVAKAVAELTTAVTELKERKTDARTDEKIEGLKDELLAKLEEMAPQVQKRRSFALENVIEEQGLPALKRKGVALSTVEKLSFMHSKPVEAAALWSRRPKETVEAFHEAADDMTIIGAILGFQARQENRAFDVRETDYWSESYLPAMHAAMDSTTTAEGDEFVPTELSSSLIARVNLQLRVAALFDSAAMPSQPWEIPAYPVARQRLGVHPEQTADTGQTKMKVITPATRKVVLTAVKFAGRVLTSRELEEDSIIAILPFIRRELVDYLSADIEDAIVNGDTAGTHMDYDTTTADDPRKSWDGLRKRTQAAAKTDASAAALSVAMLRKNRKTMGKYGITPDQLAHVLSINSYIDLLSDTAVFTLEKYGPQATILAGELGSVDSIPLIISEYQRTDLNASGVNDQTAANNTKTLDLTVNRRGYMMGSRRGLTVEVLRELYAESDQDLVLASWRRAFQSLYPTTELTVAYHYNVLK
jgi:HK97 family phage major capsid protein